MRIKQKQAWFKPNQNSTNTICSPNDGRKFAIQLSKTNWTSTTETASTNEENFPSQLLELNGSPSRRGKSAIQMSKRNWTSTKFQKLLQPTMSEFSITINCTSPKFQQLEWTGRECFITASRRIWTINKKKICHQINIPKSALMNKDRTFHHIWVIFHHICCKSEMCSHKILTKCTGLVAVFPWKLTRQSFRQTRLK